MENSNSPSKKDKFQLNKFDEQVDQGPTKVAQRRKIVVLGNASVGKTSIISRFVYNHMPKSKKATIGALEHSKSYYLEKSSKDLSVVIWDVSGQDRFRSIANMYYRDADAAIIVYDITDPKSFDDIESWIDELRDKAPKNIEIVIVGNKVDLIDQEKVAVSRGSETALKYKVLFKRISAKNNTGVHEVFQKLGEKLITKPSNVTFSNNYSR